MWLQNQGYVESRQKAYVQLYDKLSKQVYRIAFLYIKDEELAKDVLQEVFLTLWNNKDMIGEKINTIESYLFQCTRNKSIDLIRKSKSRQTYLEYVKPNLPIACYDTENTVSFRILEQEINSIVAHLPEKCRTVYQLSRKENLDNKTIACQLNISEKTVKNHLTRALDTLRTQLKYKI